MKRLVAVLTGIAILVGLLWLLKPTPPPTEPAAVLATAPAPAPRVFEIATAAEASVLQVSQGDDIVLRIESDKNDEVHLHGYDLSLKLQAGTPAELRFTANRSGRFEFELHRHHRVLGVLEVSPR